ISTPRSSATTEACAVGHQAEASVANTPVQSLDTEDVGSVPVYNYAPFLALDGNFQSKRRDVGLAKGEAFDNIDYSLSASLGYTVSTAIWLEYSTSCAYHLNSEGSSTHPAGTVGNQVSFKIILEAALAASGVIDGEFEGDDEMPELEEVEESSDEEE
ncbi:hypothetical protein DFH09DRAFT_1218110, partial [Mycena vulgaris]